MTDAWTGELGDVGLCWTGGDDATPQPDGHRGKALTLALELDEGRPSRSCARARYPATE